jgi:hypothetical protein
MATNLTPATSYLHSGAWTQAWQSIYSFELVPQIWKEVFYIYGNSFDLFEFLNLMGNTMNIKGRNLKIFEQAAIEKPITLADIGTGVGIATGAAGATISFKISTADYDTNNNPPLRVGDSILIPRAYQTNTAKEYEYRVMSVSGTTNTLTFVAMPFNKAGTSFTAAQIATAVPIGTKLAVTRDSYGTGTRQPSGTTYGSLQRTFYSGINKETFALEGGMLAQENYLDYALKGGGSGLYNRAFLQAEFLLNKKINHSLWTGEFNDNTSLVDTNKYNESVAILASRGLLEWMQLLAQKQNYFDKYEVADLDDIKPLMINNGVTAQDVLFGVGDLLYRDIENGAYDFIKEFSKTDIMTKINEVGVEFKGIRKQSFRYLVKEFANLSNPNTYGLSSYNDVFRSMGFMIPMGENKVMIGDEQQPAKLGNLMLGYLNDKGENRQRVMGVVNGMSGQSAPVMNDYDAIEGYMLSENMLVATKVNQMVLINKTA